nr:MAG TPA: hypothetical protein [Caudoviricetes sp.]
MATRQDVIFKGLTNSPSDYNCQDGELATCLNLINEDGALHPIHQPVVAEQNITLNAGDTIELVHKVTHDETIHSHYIIRKSDDTWFWMEKGGDGTRKTIDLKRFHANAVTAVGNILCFVGDEKTIYAYWKGNNYTSFDLSSLNYSATITNVKSEKCDVSISLGDDWDNAFETNRHFNNNVDTSLKGASIIFNAFDALINKRLNEKGKEYFKYTVLGVLAIKLYDGTSHINISNPFILAPETTFNKFIWYQEKKSVGTSTSLHTHTINVNMDIPEGLEDLILGVDVYLSQPESFIDTEKRTIGISRYKCFLWNSNMASGVNCDAFQYLSEEGVYQSFENKSFYLSTSINKEKLGTDVQLKRVLQTEESISLEDFKRDSFGGKCSITYNNRLHIGNIKKTIYNAFDTDIFSKRKISNTQLSLNEYVDIGASSTATTDYICDAVFKVSISENSIKRDIYHKGKLQYPICPILAYPSTLATAMTIYFHLPKYNKYYLKRVHLKPSEKFGMSYYINISKNRTTPIAVDRQSSGSLNNQGFGGRDDAPTEEEKAELSDYMYLYHDDAGLPAFMQIYRHKLLKKANGAAKAGSNGGDSFGNQNGTVISSSYYWDNTPIDTGDFTEITKEEYDAAASNVVNQKYITQNPNVIKVSEAENPLVFPAANSVQVGSSIISALSANTRPISEGQFGEAPLYAFTDEGVWVVMLSETGSYQSRQPALREICSNPKGILQIDDAVLYPTERGIMMQQGRESVCITDALDDYPFDFLSIYSHSTKDKTYPNKLLATGKIPESDVKYVRFRKYLEKADMIYDYYDSRIIVFNPYYTYAYVYSLKSKMWGAMHNVFNKRVNIYPEAYATDKAGKILDVYVKEPSESVPFFLCSRPLTLGQDVYKTMFDCITRGYFSSIQAGKFGMVLFGSNDLVNWYYISSSVDIFLRSLVGSPYKYFRIALISKLAPNESISGLSTAFQERLQNKLR